MWWWEKQQFPWRERSISEKRWLYLLDAFFAPYLAMLPRPKGNLLREVFGERHTYQKAADERQLYDRSHARAQTLRALQGLTQLIANDDPEFMPPKDGRARDFEAETAAAERVFDRYIKTQRIELEKEEE